MATCRMDAEQVYAASWVALASSSDGVEWLQVAPAGLHERLTSRRSTVDPAKHSSRLDAWPQLYQRRELPATAQHAVAFRCLMCKGELARFLLRTEALKLYRQCCRAIRGAPPGSRGAST